MIRLLRVATTFLGSYGVGISFTLFIVGAIIGGTE